MRSRGASHASRGRAVRIARTSADGRGKIHAEVAGRIAFTPGRALHLWHGTIANRRYAQRNKELYQMAFDPRTDLRISQTGCWEWASDKPELHEWARRYFEDRREDEED